MKRVLLLVGILSATVVPTALAKSPALDVNPRQLEFGKQPFGSTSSMTISVTNTSSAPVLVSIEEIRIPDSFSPGQTGSTCAIFEAARLEPGQSCTHIVAFFADPSPGFAGKQTGEIGITGRSEDGTIVYSRSVKMSGRGVEPTLTNLIDSGDRSAIRTWALERSIATLNSDVAALDQAHRDRLAEVVLDTNATGADRDKMLQVMRTVLDQPDRGFYAEIWSYTFIELTGGGFFGTCNHLFLSPDAWAGLSGPDALAVLMHESFHSFDCVNLGPPGSLDEGSAIWVAKSTFPAGLNPAETWAEATYGTKLYYRDIVGNPDYPLQAPDASATAKLRDAYALLAARDPSHMPWNSNERLVGCFQRYFETLDRNVDFLNVWLPAVEERTQQMLADSECRPI